ncbi:hypothetical protein LCGC14_0741000 [marine sediment metagenome]|uniref:Uncharacterized protein n=1 Tax=marine sediment metagenome TaxID=412755 RepID=A0A0F9Q6P2_9ZZZZ
MTIEEQRQAIREGLALLFQQREDKRWRGYKDIDYADLALAFLTEKGAVLKVEGYCEELEGGKTMGSLHLHELPVPRLSCRQQLAILYKALLEGKMPGEE